MEYGRVRYGVLESLEYQTIKMSWIYYCSIGPPRLFELTLYKLEGSPNLDLKGDTGRNNIR